MWGAGKVGSRRNVGGHPSVDDNHYDARGKRPVGNGSCQCGERRGCGFLDYGVNCSTLGGRQKDVGMICDADFW